MIRLYDLLPLIIRMRDAEASGGEGIDPILARVTDRLLQDEADEHVALVQGLRDLYDCLQVENPYRTLLFQFLGQQRAEGWSESLERFVLCETIPWHKISGTVHGWEKTMAYRLAGAYDFFELYKTELNETGDYSNHTNATYPYRAARVGIAPAGLFPYEQSDTITTVPPYVPGAPTPTEPTTEIDYDTTAPDEAIDYETFNPLFASGEKIVSTERGADFRFGYGVESDGDDLFISEPAWNDPNTASPNQGRVSRYRKNTAGSWVYQDHITRQGFHPVSMNSVSSAGFGADFDIEGGYFIGAWWNLGFAFVYKRQGDGSFAQIDYLSNLSDTPALAMGTEPETGDVFLIAMGNSNQVWLFGENAAGDGFDLLPSLEGIDGAASVAVSGNRVAVGRPFLSSGGVAWVGQVDIYEVYYNTTLGTLDIRFLKTVTQTDRADAIAWATANTEVGPRFGLRVDLRGDELAVTTDWPRRDSVSSDGGTITFVGGVDLYYDADGAGDYTYFQRLTRTLPEDGTIPGVSGVLLVNLVNGSVLIGDDFVAVGSVGDRWDADFANFMDVGTGTVTIFEGAYGYNGYLQSQVLAPFGVFGRQDNNGGADEKMNFSAAMTLIGNTLAVGAWGDNFDENGINEFADAGAVYTFERDVTTVNLGEDRDVLVCLNFAIIPVGGLDLTYDADDTTSILVQSDMLPPQSILAPPSTFTGPFNKIGVRIRAWAPSLASLHVNHALAVGEANDRSATINSMVVTEYEFWWNPEDLGVPQWNDEDIDWPGFWISFSTESNPVYVTAAELIVQQGGTDGGLSLESEIAGRYFAKQPTYNLTYLQAAAQWIQFAPTDPPGSAETHSLIRWRDVPLNQGAVINSAVLKMPNPAYFGSYTASYEMRVYGIFMAPSFTFPNTTAQAEALTRTTGYVEWNITSLGDLTDPEVSVDISSIIQTIVAHPDWVYGSYLGLNIRNAYTGPLPGGLGRIWHDIGPNSDPEADRAVLEINFEPTTEPQPDSCLVACECLTQGGEGCTTSCETGCQTLVETASCSGQCQVSTEEGAFFSTPDDQDGVAQLQYELEATIEVNACLGNVLRFTDAMALLNRYFRDQRPIHVLPVYCVTVFDLPAVAPQAGDDFFVRVIPKFNDDANSPQFDDLQIIPACTQGCQVNCETFCEVGCEDNCQGIGPCENSCQLNCEANCQTDCEVVCQAGCVISCQNDACQSFCQSACEEVCQIACEDVCQGACEIAGCQLSCTSGCEDNCQFDCQQACEADCQSPAEQACQTSCQEFCETCCQEACEDAGCQTTCELVCQASCVSGCEAACETNCQSACEGSCQGVCEFNCQAGCEGGGCETSCEGGCEGGCQSSCEVTCEGASCQQACEGQGCQSCCECQCQSQGCESSCTSGCTSGCQQACESACQASGGCETGCEMSCEGSAESCQDCCEVCCEQYTEYGCNFGSCESTCTASNCQSACQGTSQGCQTTCELVACETVCQTPCMSACQASCTSAFEGCTGGVEGCGFLESIA